MTTPWRTRLTASALLFVLFAGPASGEYDALTFEDRVVAVVRTSAQPSTIMVIRLHHAEAEELAVTLRRVLPPDVKVVPHPPTNSLIISISGSTPAQAIAPE